MSVVVETETATVQYDDPDCQLGFTPNQYDLQQNIMLDPTKKIQFVELHRIVK